MMNWMLRRLLVYIIYHWIFFNLYLWGKKKCDMLINFCFHVGVFNFDPDYLENEEKYKEIKSQIVGDESDDDDDDESGSEDSDDDENDNDDDEEELAKKMEIHDKTNTNLITLRKTIYLTIKSSLDFEECCHKLMKLNRSEERRVGKECR